MHQVEQAVRDRAARALRTAAEMIITDAKQHCPLDTGQLQMSHNTGPVQISGNVMYVPMGCNKPYAAIVHENLKLKINTDRNPLAESKWFERAIIRKRPLALNYIASEIRKAEAGTKGGGG